jgi:hypothetical protein
MNPKDQVNPSCHALVYYDILYVRLFLSARTAGSTIKKAG